MNYEAFEKLVKLKEKGILSEEEFQIEKKKLLARADKSLESLHSPNEILLPQEQEGKGNENKYNESSEHSSRESASLMFWTLFIFIVLLVTVLYWNSRQEDSASSYNYSSSNYTNTTTGSTVNTKSVEDIMQEKIQKIKTKNANKKTNDLSNEEVAEILWGKEYTKFGKDIIGPTLWYFDESLNPKEEGYTILKRLNSDATLNIDPKKLAHIYLFAMLIRWGEFSEDTEFNADLFSDVARTARAVARDIEQKGGEDVGIFKLMEFGYLVSYWIDKGNDREYALKESYKTVYGKTSLKEAKELYDDFVDSTYYLIQKNVPTNSEYKSKK